MHIVAESDFYMNIDCLVCIIEKEGKALISVSPTGVPGVDEVHYARILNHEDRRYKTDFFFEKRVCLFALV